MYDAFALRRCTRRLSAKVPSPACALADLGRCSAPCELGTGAEDYRAIVAGLTEALETDVRPAVRTVGGRMSSLASQQRFEEAAEVRRRLTTYLQTTRRFHRLQALARCSQIVAARRENAAWQIHVIRYGRLAAAADCPPSGQPPAVGREAADRAETVTPPVAPLPAASIEEAERVASWLEQPGVRLLDIQGEWSWPVHIGLDDVTLKQCANRSGEASAKPQPDQQRPAEPQPPQQQPVAARERTLDRVARSQTPDEGQEMSTDSITTGSTGRSPAPVGVVAILSTTSREASSATSPKMV